MKKLLKIDPLIKVKSSESLYKEPVVIYVSEISDETSQNFSEEISEAHNTGQPVIPVIINSEGGDAYHLMSMISDMDHSMLPIATIVPGVAMSAACVLLTCGTEGYRYASPNATIMIHDVSSWHGGKTEEIKADAKETVRLNKLIFNRMARHCGQEPDFFIKSLHERGHADWYLTPRQAQKLNLINHIRLPSMDINITLDIGFDRQ